MVNFNSYLTPFSGLMAGLTRVLRVGNDTGEASHFEGWEEVFRSKSSGDAGTPAVAGDDIPAYFLPGGGFATTPPEPAVSEAEGPQVTGVNTPEASIAVDATSRKRLSARARLTMAARGSLAYRACVAVYRLIYGDERLRVVSQHTEANARMVFGSLDATNDDPDEEVDAKALATLAGRNRYIGRVAREIKGNMGGLGTPKFTEANLLVVQTKVYDLMVRDKVRPSHIAALSPMCVVLVFTPTMAEIEARKSLATLAMDERLRDAGDWYRVQDGSLVKGPTPAKA